MQDAKDLLRDGLQDCFEKTSADCSNECRDYSSKPFGDDYDVLIPGSYSDDGYRVIRSAIEKWRKGSLECINDGFWSLFKLANELERDSAKSAATAKDQTRDVIDEVFQWTKTNKSSRVKFKEWQKLAVGRRLPLGEVMQMRGKCNQPKKDLHIPLHCDFLRLFEQRLAKLRYEATLASPGMPATTDEVVSPYQVKAPEPEHSSPERYVDKKRSELRSPWKKAIRSALIHLGKDAGYQAIATWMSEQIPGLELPKYCPQEGEEKGGVDLGWLCHNNSSVRARFQKDITKVKKYLKH